VKKRGEVLFLTEILVVVVDPVDRGGKEKSRVGPEIQKKKGKV